MVYSYAEVRERLPSFLEMALTQGQVKFRGRDGRVFVIRPEPQTRTSPFDVPSISLSITKSDILESIQESRERFSD